MPYGTAMRSALFLLGAGLLFSSVTQAQDSLRVPVFEIARSGSAIHFAVDASIAISGTFNKWNAALTFSSPDVSTAALNIEVQAASVDTGSGLKDSTLKGEDFFDVEKNPVITFKSTKIVQTGANAFELDGNFTIRGVTKPERLSLTISGRGTGSGTIKGTMAFDRKDYGMDSGIPFIRIADRVEVTVDLKVKRVGGPPMIFKQ
ncbi:MAG TPA: YceI family protein [Candidatus Binataceae bacterium]|nr:YceI family protein [Candidatus Binataceae bacterium]